MTPAQIEKIMSLVDQYAATRNAGYIGSFGTPAEARAAVEAALRYAPQWPPCRGVPRAGCNYLAACDTVCNKCGEVHRFPFATPSAPTALEPAQRWPVSQDPLTQLQVAAIISDRDTPTGEQSSVVEPRDERAEFEEWCEAHLMPAESDWFRREPDEPDEYRNPMIDMAWEAWQARGLQIK